MTDHDETTPAPGPAPETAPSQVPPLFEQVGRGIFFALGAVVGGVVLTVVVWRLGFIASITSFAMAAGAVYLYDKGAGTTPRKGLVPLVALIILGVVASFFAVIASDAWDAYDAFGFALPQSRLGFVGDNMFRGEVLKEYGKDMAMFGVFAVLGIFSTMRRLMRAATA
jgi:hypothetical protein